LHKYKFAFKEQKKTSTMNKIIQSVPNFSEGRDLQKIEKIVDCFRAKAGVKLLDYSNDKDHNRFVVSVIGEPEALKNALIEAIGKATELIDMTQHIGQHPRMGATDVVPFIPIKNVTEEEAVALSKEVAQAVSQKYDIPVFLYEKSASAAHRQNLASVRKGKFEGLTEKMMKPEWQPDFGKPVPHPTAGAIAIGVRKPLIAYNVNLGTNDLEIANAISKKIRHIGGGLRHCKAMGVALEERGIVQVSMNLTDYTKTAIYQAQEMIRIEANRYGVPIIGAEIIGLVPMEALAESAAHYLGIENFSMNKILEYNL
jgi:glutamate formiminotransferase